MSSNNRATPEGSGGGDSFGQSGQTSGGMFSEQSATIIYHEGSTTKTMGDNNTSGSGRDSARGRDSISRDYKPVEMEDPEVAAASEDPSEGREMNFNSDWNNPFLSPGSSFVQHKGTAGGGDSPSAFAGGGGRSPKSVAFAPGTAEQKSPSAGGNPLILSPQSQMSQSGRSDSIASWVLPEAGDDMSDPIAEGTNSKASAVTLRTTAKVADAMSNPSEASAVKVMVRVRPFNEREFAMEEEQFGTRRNIDPVVCVSDPEKMTVLTLNDPATRYPKEAFAFDQVLWSVQPPSDQHRDISRKGLGGTADEIDLVMSSSDRDLAGARKTAQLVQGMPAATQEDVFSSVAQPMVVASAAGYNCSILAYGQTGSGKTYSMLGGTGPSPSDGGEDTRGIAPRLVKQIFQHLKRVVKSTNGAVRCTVHLSFLEIYNEKVKDLLAGMQNEEEVIDSNNSFAVAAMKPTSSGGLRGDKTPPQGNRSMTTPPRRTPTSPGRTTPRSPVPEGSTVGGGGSTLKGRQSKQNIHQQQQSQQNLNELRTPKRATSMQARRGLNSTSPKPGGGFDSPVTAQSPASLPKGSPSQAPPEREPEYKECKVRYHHSIGTFVEGLTRQDIYNETQCQDLIRWGIEHRATAATKMNSTSSRSHAIFQLCVRQRDDIRGTQKLSIINLVDLAGSERVKLSGASGQTFVEAKNINQSLSTLRRVIDALLENSALIAKRSNHRVVPPYRESMLTWLLSDSLGGNSRTAMLATVSPHVSNYEDTYNTLRYALKAKAIVCHVKVNETKTTVVVDAIKKEMELLQAQLRKAAEGDDSKQRLAAEQLAALKENLKDREDELNQAMDEQRRSEEQRKNLKMEIAEHEQALNTIQEELAPKLAVWEEHRKLDQEHNEIQRLREVQEEQARAEEKLKEKRKDELVYERKRRQSLINKSEMKRRMKTKYEEERDANTQSAWATFFKTVVAKDKLNRETRLWTDTRNTLRQQKHDLAMRFRRLEVERKKTTSDIAYLGPRSVELEAEQKERVDELEQTTNEKFLTIRTTISSIHSTEDQIRLTNKESAELNTHLAKAELLAGTYDSHEDENPTTGEEQEPKEEHWEGVVGKAAQDLTEDQNAELLMSSTVCRVTEEVAELSTAEVEDLQLKNQVSKIEQIERNLSREVAAIRQKIQLIEDRNKERAKQAEKEGTEAQKEERKGNVLARCVENEERDISRLEEDLKDILADLNVVENVDHLKHEDQERVLRRAEQTENLQQKLETYVDEKTATSVAPSQSPNGKIRRQMVKKATRLEKAPTYGAHGKLKYNS